MLTDDDLHASLSNQAPSPPLLAKRSMSSAARYGYRLVNDTTCSGWPTTLWLADALLLLKLLAKMQHYYLDPQWVTELHADVSDGLNRYVLPDHKPKRQQPDADLYADVALCINTTRAITRQATWDMADANAGVARALRDVVESVNADAGAIDLPHARDWLIPEPERPVIHDCTGKCAAGLIQPCQFPRCQR